MAESNYDISVRIQEKFDVYFLGLTFTILGLSIQTAHFGTRVLADAAEVVAWLALLAAGLAGLSRMEGIPEVYRLFGVQNDQEEKARAGKKAKMEGLSELHIMAIGRAVPIANYIAEAEAGVATVEGVIKPLQRRAARRYRFMKLAFVIGLMLLILARALPPLAGILHAIGWWHTPPV